MDQKSPVYIGCMDTENTIDSYEDQWICIESTCIVIQYTLANPNRGVPIQKILVPMTEFVRISEVALILWRKNSTKICANRLLLV